MKCFMNVKVENLDEAESSHQEVLPCRSPDVYNPNTKCSQAILPDITSQNYEKKRIDFIILAFHKKIFSFQNWTNPQIKKIHHDD